MGEEYLAPKTFVSPGKTRSVKPSGHRLKSLRSPSENSSRAFLYQGRDSAPKTYVLTRTGGHVDGKNLLPSSKRRKASETLKSTLRTHINGIASQPQGRHVKFQDSPSTQKPSSVYPAFRQRLSGLVNEVTEVDHKIARRGGSTSTIECLPYRLRISKVQPLATPQQRIEELQRENGHLRRELIYYKETREVLMKMLEATKASHKRVRDILTEATHGVAISEQRYVGYFAPRDDNGYEENVF